MKIDANVQFNAELAKKLGCCSTTVAVDADYVEDNVEAVEEWVRNELEDKFNCLIDACGPMPFEVTNIDDIIEDIKFDEFQDKAC